MNKELGTTSHFEARLSQPVIDWLEKITPEKMTLIEMAAAIVTDAFFEEENPSVPEKLTFLIGRMRFKYDTQQILRLFKATSEELNVSYKHIIAYDRHPKFSDARLIASKILREKVKMSLPDTANIMCRDHTTVLHSVRSSDRRIASNQSLQKKYVAVLKAMDLANG